MHILIWVMLSWQAGKPVDLTPVTSALRENRFAIALQRTETLLAQNESDPRIWTLQGLAHLGLEEQRKALDDFRRAVNLSPDYLPALKAEAQIEYALQDQQSIRTLSHITRLEPNDPVTHAMLGALAYRAHDCPSVVKNYSASAASIETQAAALSEFGECLFQTGHRNESIAVLTKAVNLQPASWQARYNLAVANLLLHRATQSLAALQPVLNSLQPQVLDVASTALELIGDTPRAVETLRQAILTDPSKAYLYLRFADLCFAHSSFQVGIDMLNSGLRQLPSSAQLYLARGILSVQLGAYEKAEDDFAKAAELDPSQTFSSVAQGLTQLQQSNLDSALEITRAQLKKTSSDAYLYYLEAEILRQKGVDPGTAEFGEAVTAALKALRLRPAFPLAQDLLGVLYLRQAKPALAVQQFERVLQMEPGNESALYHLITASRKLGNTDALPDLMQRLAHAKALNREKDQRANRFTFIEPHRSQ